MQDAFIFTQVRPPHTNAYSFYTLYINDEEKGVGRELTSTKKRVGLVDMKVDYAAWLDNSSHCYSISIALVHQMCAFLFFHQLNLDCRAVYPSVQMF